MLDRVRPEAEVCSVRGRGDGVANSEVVEKIPTRLARSDKRVGFRFLSHSTCISISISIAISIFMT